MYQANTNSQISTIFLNSDNAKKSNNSYEFDMTSAISCPLSQNILLSVAEFETPNTFPIFDSTNNIFNYTINHPVTNSVLFTMNLVIPSTIMNPVDFSNYVNYNYITTKPTGYDEFIFSVNYNRQTFILEFSCNTHFNIIYSNASKVLGLNDEYPIYASQSPAYSIRQNPVSFIFTNNIFIKTQEFTLNNINSYGDITNTMARVQVNCNPGQMIFYKPIELNRFIIATKTIKKLTFSFENDRNQPIINLNFQLLLKVELVYPQVQDDSTYQSGTIDYYLKNNIIPVEEEEQDEAFGV